MSEEAGGFELGDSGVLIALITSGFGAFGLVVAGKVGSKKEERQSRKALEAKCRSWEDYSIKCRGAMITAGLIPPEYPVALTDDDES